MMYTTGVCKPPSGLALSRITGYQSFGRTFLTSVYNLLRCGAWVTAATAMAISAVAGTGSISCPPSSITTLPPPITIPIFTTGHGQFTVKGPTFSPAPGNCPGFTATDYSIIYEASEKDNLQNVTIFATFVLELSFPDSPSVGFFTSADGSLNYTNGLVLRNVHITTFNALPTGLGIATVDTGAVPSGSSFSGSMLSPGTAQLEPDSGNLQLTIEIDLFQAGDATTGDSFAIFFPGSLLAAALPQGSGLTDVSWENYFSNANTPTAPDATLRITNPGLSYDNLCALIYVFDANQELSECCGCIQSPDGLRTLSVNNDLTNNPLTGVKSTNGVIKIVSGRFLPSDPCEPATDVPEPNLRAFMTHAAYPDPMPWTVLETASWPSPLGATELSALQAQCAFIKTLGSGQGTCTCGAGD